MCELLQEREKRVSDAIALEVSDRVPVMVNFGFFAARYGGFTCQEVMYDPDKMAAAWTKAVSDFQPDTYDNPFGSRHGAMLAEIIDYKMMKWPGHGIDVNRSFQYIDSENLKPDEYDEFLFDPTDFIIRKFWPRVFGNLGAFRDLPSVRLLHSHTGFLAFAGLDTPEMDAAFAILDKVRKQAAVHAAGNADFVNTMETLGFPPIFGPRASVPFDIISDQFRGTRGAMIDMYRRPDKLVAAIEKVLPMTLRSAVAASKRTSCKRVFIALHKGQEFFMSPDQYRKFYWPGFRALMIGLIDAGLNPCPFVEGEYTSRLEILADVPKGKVCYHFEQVDFEKAKAVLKGIACIRGGIPISLMCTGMPGEIKERCKKMIDTVGKDGGYIMDTGAALDDARPENVHAMIEITKEYGVYR